MANRLFGLVGIYEKFVEEATGPCFQVGCGFGWKQRKQLAHEAVSGLVAIVCDPVSCSPAKTCFGAGLFTTSLCHLYTNMAQTLQKLSEKKDVFVMQSELDIYTEIVINHGKQKWLEPALLNHLNRYDKLFYITPKHLANASEKEKKYDLVVRRLMHDFKIKPIQVDDPAEIRQYVQDSGRELPNL